MRTQVASAVRRASYDVALERALPAVVAARRTFCSTGVHFRDFLNACGVPAPSGGDWSVNSANRAVRRLIARGLFKAHRHRGRRAKNLEDARKKHFAKAAEAYRMKCEAARSQSGRLHRPIDSFVNLSDDAIQNHPGAEVDDAIQVHLDALEI